MRVLLCATRLTLPLWQRLGCLHPSPFPRLVKDPLVRFFPVKLLRVWLLVLLAVLLPVRGAMAAAIGCAPAGAPVSSQAVVAGAGAGHHAHAHDGAAHGHADAGHAHAGHGTAEGHAGVHDDGKSHLDKCNLCSASCSATPLVREVAGVPELNDAGSATFPSLFAPAPTFLSDGQERPPRSI